MITYDLGDGVEAWSTNIGDPAIPAVITPEYQAHSTRVAIIPDEASQTYGVDALITDRPGVAIGVRTADCVPILLYDPTRRAIGAVHSGWKGTIANVTAVTIKHMVTAYGCNPQNMSAVIGPCIRQEAFEVGDEVYASFREAGYDRACRLMTIPGIPNSALKWHINLAAAVERQLLDCGITKIVDCGICTYREHERFYSYRRDHCVDRQQRIVTAISLVNK